MANTTKEMKGAESFTVEGSFEEIKSDPPFININFNDEGSVDLESNLSNNVLKEIFRHLSDSIEE